MTNFTKITTANYLTTITLNRPEKRNALNAAMITELIAHLKIANKPPTRILMLHAEGEHFCAGGDIAWMQQTGCDMQAENLQDAKLLAELLFTLYTFPKPTLVLAQGAVLGGGLGLLTAADIAIATDTADFGFPEVQIGLIPAVISPYVIAAMGKRLANYYFLTAKRFSAQDALAMGMIHKIVSPNNLLSEGQSICQALLKAGPRALAAAKKLLQAIDPNKIDKPLTEKLAQQLATLRATPEAQEGLQAYLQKRKPAWCNLKDS